MIFLNFKKFKVLKIQCEKVGNIENTLFKKKLIFFPLKIKIILFNLKK